jgi:CheY-like chemotaxis protein
MENSAIVLVIDDDVDEDNRQAFRLVLEAAHYTVSEAHNGQSGLEVLRSHHAPLVVLLDWLMPGMDGAQVLDAIATDGAAARRHAYILMSASSQRPEYQALMLPEGLDVTFLSKPSDIDELITRVAAAAARLANQSDAG